MKNNKDNPVPSLDKYIFEFEKEKEDKMQIYLAGARAFKKYLQNGVETDKEEPNHKKVYYSKEIKEVMIPKCPKCNNKIQKETNPDARTLYHWKCNCGYKE